MYKRILFIAERNMGAFPNVMLHGIPHALERLGYEVMRLMPETCDYDQFATVCKNFQPELVFGTIGTYCVKVGSFLKALKVAPALNWWLEDPNGNEMEVFEASKAFDLWLTINPQGPPYWPTKSCFVPLAYDETIFQPLAMPKQFDVSFIGTTGDRLGREMSIPYLNALASRGQRALLCIERPLGVPILPKPLEMCLRSRKLRRLWQFLPVWKHTWKTPRNGLEKNVFINQSKIHFAYNTVRGEWELAYKKRYPDYPLGECGWFVQVKARLFEGVGSGAMVLTDNFPGLENMFDVGQEVVTYTCGCSSEIKEKLEWYLRNDSERERIARAGNERARTEHTLTCRVRQIMQLADKML